MNHSKRSDKQSLPLKGAITSTVVGRPYGLRLGGGVYILELTAAYHTTKFWANISEYYGLNNSPWTYSIPTTDELKAGIEGANDGLFGDTNNCRCS